MRFRDLFQAGGSPTKSPGAIFELAGIFLLVLYLLAGVIYSAALAPVARFPDEQDYLALSYHLLHGPGYSLDGVHLTACRPPGYAFFLAAIRLCGGDFISFRVAQFLLLGVSIFLVSRLCLKHKPFGGVFTATALFICYPLLFYTSATLYPQILSGFLFLLALHFTLATSQRPLCNLLAGLSFGALILAVPTFLLTMGVVLFGARFLKLVAWRDVLVIGFLAVLLVGIWTSRNAVLFRHFVPVASNSGLNLLTGNNDRATADTAAANEGVEPYYWQTVKLGLDEFQTDHFYQEAALTWITSHPVRAAILYLEKVLNFFNFMNVYAPLNHEEISAWKQVVMAASYILLMGLLIWRMTDIRRFPLLDHEKLFLIIYISSAFTSAIFFTRIRHRLPYDYLIISIVALNLSLRLQFWMSAKGAAQPAP